jgi:flagellar biosynthesis GTPase FlhF
VQLLPPEAQQKFFQDAKALRTSAQLTELLVHTCVARKVQQLAHRTLSEFLPLSVWESRGFDVEKIRDNSAADHIREHPVLGSVYAVDVESLSRSQLEEHAECAVRKQLFGNPEPARGQPEPPLAHLAAGAQRGQVPAAAPSAAAEEASEASASASETASSETSRSSLDSSGSSSTSSSTPKKKKSKKKTKKGKKAAKKAKARKPTKQQKKAARKREEAAKKRAAAKELREQERAAKKLRDQETREAKKREAEDLRQSKKQDKEAQKEREAARRVGAKVGAVEVQLRSALAQATGLAATFAQDAATHALAALAATRAVAEQVGQGWEVADANRELLRNAKEIQRQVTTGTAASKALLAQVRALQGGA